MRYVQSYICYIRVGSLRKSHCARNRHVSSLIMRLADLGLAPAAGTWPSVVSGWSSVELGGARSAHRLCALAAAALGSARREHERSRWWLALRCARYRCDTNLAVPTYVRIRRTKSGTIGIWRLSVQRTRPACFALRRWDRAHLGQIIYRSPTDHRQIIHRLSTDRLQITDRSSTDHLQNNHSHSS